MTDPTHQGQISETITRVSVDVAGKPYDVLIGEELLQQAGSLIKPHLNRPQTVIVTDETVANLHLPSLQAALRDDHITSETIVFPAGESTKSFTHLEGLLDQLLALGVERKDHIIALGGGVIGDLVGFAAAILRRGVRFIQCPTTLLAQVDSSVGGKTAINVPRGKNLIGAFHQPDLVLADLTTLKTLKARERRAGYAEVLKYGAIDNKEFYNWLGQNGHRVLAGEIDALMQAVTISVQSKARIVAEDEFETGKRALLNLGHTFGHAIEAALGYDGRLLHGEGVALGMVLANKLTQALGETDSGIDMPINTHLDDLGFCTSLGALNTALGTELTAEQLIDLMAQDKKMDAGTLTFILGPVGAARQVRGVDMSLVRKTLNDSLNET